jgi:hypothetical protein
MRRRLLGIGALGLALALPLAGTANGAGGPVPLNIEPTDVATPDGSTGFVVKRDGGRTLVSRLDGSSGQALRPTAIRGRFAIPAVALDGSASGLSADGKTLVLRRWRYPQGQTSFAILDTNPLRVRDAITLRGVLTLDAISPDGSRLYFIKYPSPRDASRYAVREYDVDAGRLLPDPVVDPSEHGEPMRGTPITRLVSPDGRWAYTLYDGERNQQFVHALDTLEGRAVCIDDIDALAGLKGPYRVGLGINADGTRLTIADRRGPLAFVDTRTFRVSEPTEPAGASETSSGDSGAALALIVPAAAVVLLAGGALILILRHRGHRVAAGDL